MDKSQRISSPPNVLFSEYSIIVSNFFSAILGFIAIAANRLDQILGKQGSKAKDVYASKISLASRVVKVERSVSIYDARIIRINK